MIAVSLFSGCGGLDYGFEAAGFTVAVRNDFDAHSCATLRLNGAASPFECPVKDLTAAEIRTRIGHAGTPDVLIGGPPCQPFSKSAYWSRGDTLRLKDPRADTLHHYFRLVEELRPRAFLLENVHGINYSGKEEGFQFILKQIRDINHRCHTDYRPTWRVLNAADYGVPQLRVRFFLVAFRTGKEFLFPAQTHSDQDAPGADLFSATGQPYRTAWDALRAVEPDPKENLTVGGQWADLLPSIPEGENYLWHTDRKGGLPLFGWRTRYWCFLLKLAKNRPSWTIQAQPGSAVGPFHWLNRKLSWKEMSALQTFPKSFRIDAPRVEIQRQIGNAVPSLLAEVLARAIKSQLSDQPIKDPPALAVSAAQLTPPPEPLQAVPIKYLALQGKHAAHPGTGKGRSYQNGKFQRAEEPLLAAAR